MSIMKAINNAIITRNDIISSLITISVYHSDNKSKLCSCILHEWLKLVLLKDSAELKCPYMVIILRASFQDKGNLCCYSIVIHLAVQIFITTETVYCFYVNSTYHYNKQLVS